MLRRLRSALTLAALWAVAWLPFGVIVGLALTRFATPAQSWRDFFSGLGVWTLLGALSGGVFSLLIGLFERRRTINDLSPHRLALWGAIGGAALPLAVSIALLTFFPNLHLSSAAAPVFVVMVVLGTVCAVATLQLARRGQSSDYLEHTL